MYICISRNSGNNYNGILCMDQRSAMSIQKDK